MATVTCPAGHESSTTDYCDTCGAPIEAGGGAEAGAPIEAAGGAEATGGAEAGGGEGGGSGAEGGGSGVAAAAEEASAAEAPEACPSCGEAATGRFCESCGYDLETGAPAAPRPVTLLLGTDRGHWERMVGSGEPALPAAVPALTLELTGDRAVLGRVRSGAPVDVDLALTGAAADPAVSHRQCVFVREGDTWVVTDMDSANGTWINDADQPLAAGERHVLADGDRILMGAWTCLTVQGAPAPATSDPAP